ncbi:hypothetical protein [Pseudopedobacter beijingensis]|uniref:Pectate lyase superfamily protein n=1 Tax=Pseudopedobacter beijingensis TaxID=1207056 RepID=A0ABW4IFQ9_9SPHI
MKNVFNILTFIFFICFLQACKKDKNKEEEVVVIPPKEDSGAEEPISTALVYVKNDGKLGYNFFANEGESSKINQIPDFSMAGYKGGGVKLPNATEVKITLTPVVGDNLNQIQNAITQVQAMSANSEGIRGVILLKAGVYEVSNTINITKSGVILRGEGQGNNGTILKATKKSQHTLIDISGVAVTTSRVLNKITTPYVATGKKGFKVASSSGIAVGDRIAIYRTPNEQWITDLDMAQYGWTANSYNIDFERKVTGIVGDSLILNAPIVDPMQTKYGGGSIYKLNPHQRITQVGIEDIRLSSVYVSEEDEEHGWIAVELNNAENCWVKGVTALYFGYSAVSISSNSHYNTVEDCAMLDPKSVTTGSRKYSFNLEAGASFNLFQRCFAKGGRHDFVTGSRVPGPNVFLDCVAIETNADAGPHHRWATGLLLDNISCGQLQVQNRKAMGSGHGWAGAQTLFYNCRSTKSNIKVESPKGAMNWGIGCIGLTKNGTGFWESWGVPVQPRSIYLAQLKDRLGGAAVENTTIPAQRTGNIDQLLKAWAGNGKLQAN